MAVIQRPIRHTHCFTVFDPYTAGDRLPACVKHGCIIVLQVGASERVVTLVDNLPGAQQLPLDSLVQLLHAALDNRLTYYYSVTVLRYLPAAQSFSMKTAAGLLQHAADVGTSPKTVRELCSLPALINLDHRSLVQVLLSHAAANQTDAQGAAKLRALCQLPAVHHITAVDAMPIFRAFLALTAVEPAHNGRTEQLAVLCAELPAAALAACSR